MEVDLSSRISCVFIFPFLFLGLEGEGVWLESEADEEEEGRGSKLVTSVSHASFSKSSSVSTRVSGGVDELADAECIRLEAIGLLLQLFACSDRERGNVLSIQYRRISAKQEPTL